MGRDRKWKGTTGGGRFGQRSLIFFFRYCDVRVGYFILAFVIPFYMLFARKGYRAASDYFRERHGLRGWRNLKAVYRNHYRFGQTILDRFSVFSGRTPRFRIDVEGGDYYGKLLDSDRGFVIAGSHTGNFELAGYLMKQDRKGQIAVVYGGESADMQANRAKAMGANNVTLVPVSDDMSHLFAIKEALDNGDIVSMPCDRLLGSNKSVTYEFLGAPAEFPIGAFQLAVQLEVDMIALFVMRERKMRYRLYVKPLIIKRDEYKKRTDAAAALTGEFVRELEAILKKYPEQWFNFYDFWKSAQ